MTIPTNRLPSGDVNDQAIWRLLTDSLPQLIWICNADGSCEYVSHRWQQYSGVPTSQLLATGWLEQVHPDDRRVFSACWHQSITASEALHIEARFRRHDGIYHRFDTVITPLKGNDSQINKWIVISTDVEAASTLEDANAATREQLQRMSSLANVGSWTHNVATGTDYWSDEVARIHEQAPDTAMVMDDFLSSFTAADRDMMLRAHQRAIQHAEPFDFELPLIMPRQKSKWVRMQGFPVVRHGQVVRVETAIQDITERKLAQLEVQNLHASLEYQVQERIREVELARHDLQNILDALPTMVGYWDNTLRLRFCNQAYQRTLDMSAEQLHGKHYSEVLTPTMLAERLPYMNAALQGHAQCFEPSTTKKFSRARVHFQPDIVDGVVRGVYVLVIDLTNQRQAEDSLRAANRELEAFAYAVAHDLRAPLRAMSGFSNALLEDHAAQLDAEAQNFTREIAHASRRMGKLLDGLLALSRSTQGEMRRDTVDLSAMAMAVLNELQRQDPDRQVHWQVAPGMMTFADARMLEAILHNLLSNAWKYTSKMPTAEIRVDLMYKNDIRHFRVIDNGAGFDMTHADRLFKPFQRLHRQDEFAGLGIGLATVRRIIERHGGEIYASAALGQGATFCFTLDNLINVEEQ
jgi:PAS domain S-box-containing protein